MENVLGSTQNYDLVPITTAKLLYIHSPTETLVELGPIPEETTKMGG